MRLLGGPQARRSVCQPDLLRLDALNGSNLATFRTARIWQPSSAYRLTKLASRNVSCIWRRTVSMRRRSFALA